MAVLRAATIGRTEKLPLPDAASELLDECRMVLPGIQALFGFQLVAVTNSRFTILQPFEQNLHILATILVAAAIAIIMTPAALHRQTCPQEVTESFLRISSFLMLVSMFPLAIGISLEFYLVARIVIHGMVPSILAGALFALFVVLWFILPRAEGLQRIIGGAPVHD